MDNKNDKLFINHSSRSRNSIFSSFYYHNYYIMQLQINVFGGYPFKQFIFSVELSIYICFYLNSELQKEKPRLKRERGSGLQVTIIVIVSFHAHMHERQKKLETMHRYYSYRWDNAPGYPPIATNLVLTHERLFVIDHNNHDNIYFVMILFNVSIKLLFYDILKIIMFP